MDEHEVVIAGGGPTGLMLAAELALAGVDVVVVERRTTQDLDGSRAGGLHARTLEVLDQRGVVDRFVAAGELHPAVGYAGMMLEIADFPSRHNCVLALWQRDFEPILAGWVAELGVPVLRGREVLGVVQDETGVTVEVAPAPSMRAAYLVGCDGGRSVVRTAAGIESDGLDPTTSWLVAEVDLGGEPELGMRHDALGTHGIGPLAPGGPYRVVLTEGVLARAEPTLDDLRAALIAVYGTDHGLRGAGWVSRFTDVTRQATTYRAGRMLVAGDAAHVHPPQGGQGLNTGVQDAVNLGWKLARVVRGAAPEALLDTYQAERHPVGARAIHTALAQVALGRPGARHEALRQTMAELLALDEPRRQIVGTLSGLDIRYDLGDGHPLVGRRMPDLDLSTAAGQVRAFELLHEARPVLLDFGGLGVDALDGVGPQDPDGWVRRVTATSTGPWELPVVGEVPAPDGVLIRPDGYVAWAGAKGDDGLVDGIDSLGWPRRGG